MKPWKIVVTVLALGGIFYYFKNKQLKKKYEVKNEGSFELLIQKDS